MMIINNNQFDFLRERAMNDFFDEMLLKCKKRFPNRVAILGEHLFKNAVNDIYFHAKEELNFTTRSSVEFYINATIIFGFEFLKNPKYIEFNNIYLKNIKLTQLEQTELLYDSMKNYILNVYGKNNQYYENTLNNLKEFAKADEFMIFYNIKQQDEFVDKSEILLKKLNQNILTQHENFTIKDFIYQSIDSAKSKNINQTIHFLIYLIAQYFLGHEFMSDPFHVWFESPFEQKNILPENVKQILIDFSKKFAF